MLAGNKRQKSDRIAVVPEIRQPAVENAAHMREHDGIGDACRMSFFDTRGSLVSVHALALSLAMSGPHGASDTRGAPR